VKRHSQEEEERREGQEKGWMYLPEIRKKADFSETLQEKTMCK